MNEGLFANIGREVLILAPVYLPLGLVGAWRWGVWLVKRMMAQLYRPDKNYFDAPVSVVTPVYNEDPVLFRRALDSWKINDVDEIVAVIDYTDTDCIQVFEEFSEDFSGAKMITTEKPGKRPALADGIEAARCEIVVLVDSDTIWEDNVREEGVKPFRNFSVGGVTVRQRVLDPKTLAQRIFNSQQNLRFIDEYPFLTAIDGSTVHCLSGRTAFYRRSAVVPVLDQLLNETFWGKPVISGDDKRLTYLVEAAGWQTAYQGNVSVFTPGVETMREFIKQRLRWTRNSWRADLRSLTQKWTWRKPYFALFLLDRAVQPFTLLLGPIYFVASLLLGLWIPAAILLVWWHVSRVIRLWPHLRRRPQDLAIVPMYIAISYFFGLLKIYALFTMNRQGWITRWDKTRLKSVSWIRLIPAYAATVATVVVLIGAVSLYKNEVLSISELRTARGMSSDPQVMYDGDQNRLSVVGEGPITWLEFQAGVPSSLMREVAPGRWYLGTNLTFEENVSLIVDREAFNGLYPGSTRGQKFRVLGVDSDLVR